MWIFYLFFIWAYFIGPAIAIILAWKLRRSDSTPFFVSLLEKRAIAKEIPYAPPPYPEKPQSADAYRIPSAKYYAWFSKHFLTFMGIAILTYFFSAMFVITFFFAFPFSRNSPIDQFLLTISISCVTFLFLIGCPLRPDNYVYYASLVVYLSCSVCLILPLVMSSL